MTGFKQICSKKITNFAENPNIRMTPCIFNLGTGEIIVILVVVLLLFGARRIPELARSMGKGISMFKQGMNEATSQINEPVDKKADSSTAGNQNQTQGSDAK